MSGVEMPQAPASRRIQGEQTIGEQVVPGTIGAVKVAHRRTCRGVDDSALFIERESGPSIGRTGFSPSIRRPLVVREFPGMWNSVERPAQRARMDVECADVAGWCRF